MFIKFMIRENDSSVLLAYLVGNRTKGLYKGTNLNSISLFIFALVVTSELKKLVTLEIYLFPARILVKILPLFLKISPTVSKS